MLLAALSCGACALASAIAAGGALLWSVPVRTSRATVSVVESATSEPGRGRPSQATEASGEARPDAGADAGSAPSVDSPRQGGTLRMPFDEPSALDPALVRDVSSAEYVYEVFSGLVTLSPDLEVAPDLARSWQVDPSGAIYTFTLRSDAVFHDGRPVTADDVLYAIERACDPAVGSPVAGAYLGDIVGCPEKLAGSATRVSGAVRVDRLRVALRIDAPKAYFLSKLTYPTSFVVDPGQVEGDPGWLEHPNGTGPFQVAEHSAGERIVLERFPDFHSGAPWLDRVELDMRPIDPLTRYENGELDVTPVGALDMARVTDPLNPLRFEVLRGEGDLSVNYLALNLRTAPFDDWNVRRALAQSIDRARLTQIVLLSAAVPVDTVLPPGLPGHAADANPYRYDPAAARRAVTDSAYGDAGRLPPLTLHVAGESGSAPVAEALADMLEESLPGLTVSVEQSPWDQFQAEIDAGTYGMFLLGWAADYPDPQDFLDLLFHSESPLNDTGYADPDVDAWLEAARIERDETVRLSLYRKAERRVLEAAPWVPLYGGADTWLVAPYVRGFSVPSLVRPRLAEVWLAER